MYLMGDNDLRPEYVYISSARETYTRRLREAADVPLVEFGGRIDGGRSCIFDKRLADDIYREPKSVLRISWRVFDTGFGPE